LNLFRKDKMKSGGWYLINHVFYEHPLHFLNILTIYTEPHRIIVVFKGVKNKKGCSSLKNTLF
jgi:hypothetical protein